MYECKKQVEWLWKALEELSGEEMLFFIQHWTGCAKVPAGGVKDMKLDVR